jgi:hypothetical protein
MYSILAAPYVPNTLAERMLTALQSRSRAGHCQSDANYGLPHGVSADSLCLDHHDHCRAAVRPSAVRLPHVRRNRVLCDDDYNIPSLPLRGAGYHYRCWHLSAHNLPDNLPHDHGNGHAQLHLL